MLTRQEGLVPGFASRARAVIPRRLRRAPPTGIAAALLLALAAPARSQVRVGSFVSGERPMYIEATPMVEGQPFHLELRNVEPGSKLPLLVYGSTVAPLDLSPWGIPGFLGPDLATSGIYAMS